MIALKINLDLNCWCTANVFCHVFQWPYECRTRQCNGRQATTITQAPRALHNIAQAFHHHFLSPRDFSTLIAPFQSPPASQHRFYCYIVMHGAPILKTPRVNVPQTALYWANCLWNESILQFYAPQNNVNLHSALSWYIYKALRCGPCVTRGSHTFTCHPHTNHIWSA